MACTNCGQKRKGTGAAAPARRTREVAKVGKVTVEVTEGALPVNVLIPMRLLQYHSGRKLLISARKVELPEPVAEWLAERLPGQVTILAAEPEPDSVAGSAQKATAVAKTAPKKKKASSK